MVTNNPTRYGILITAFAAIMLLTALVGCNPQATPISVGQGMKVQVDDGFYTNIGPSELAAMLRSKDFTLVNVHIPYDGEIEKTDLFIPFDSVKQSLGRLPQARNSKIVVYCRSGAMSTSAASDLVRSGYTNVYNLDGGMTELKQQGHQIISKK